MKKINIAGRFIGEGEPPYIVAELSGNHNGDISSAIRLLEVAKESGADAVKLQTYTPDTMTIKSDMPFFQIKDGPWAGRDLYDLYDWAHTPWDWHQKLFEKAESLGITIFSSPFDETAVDLLESLNAPAYKIASFEVVDLALIQRVAKTQKPIIISTGMANESEVEDAIAVVRSVGNEKIILLHCVSSYPCPIEESNLKKIPFLSSKFDVVSGLSDHTLGNLTAIAGVALGAAFVEKHVTLRRADGGPDAAFSLEPEELKELVTVCKMTQRALGEGLCEPRGVEENSTIFRRSLFIVNDLKAGDVLTRDNVRCIRPGYGMLPKNLERVIGMRVNEDVKRGTPLTESLIA